MQPHYLVKHRCSKLSHNTGIYYNYYTVNPASIGRASTDWVAECLSRLKESVFVDVLLSGTRTDVKTIILWVGRGSNGEQLKSKNMKFTVRFGYLFSNCRARVILACLLSTVSSWAVILFRHLSCSSFFTIRWTLDRWMPDSQYNCNKFQCYFEHLCLTR